MHDSRTVANKFLDLAAEHDDVLTPMKLLKLVYIAHGWMLGLYGDPLIKDEVQAWKFGPVIPMLYRATKDYRGSPVLHKLAAPVRDDLDEIEDDLVGQVYDRYGEYDGTALSRLTHRLGTPWALTYVDGEFGTVIPTELIRKHYERLATPGTPHPGV